MKTRRNLYLTVGVILIVLNLLLDIAEFNRFKSLSEGNAYNIGYFIGSHLFLFAGLFLLRMAYKVQKRINNKQTREMIDNIGKPDIG